MLPDKQLRKLFILWFVGAVVIGFLTSDSDSDSSSWLPAVTFWIWLAFGVFVLWLNDVTGFLRSRFAQYLLNKSGEGLFQITILILFPLGYHFESMGISAWVLLLCYFLYLHDQRKKHNQREQNLKNPR